VPGGEKQDDCNEGGSCVFSYNKSDGGCLIDGFTLCEFTFSALVFGVHIALDESAMRTVCIHYIILYDFFTNLPVRTIDVNDPTEPLGDDDGLIAAPAAFARVHAAISIPVEEVCF
jgi:hypothetical protein